MGGKTMNALIEFFSDIKNIETAEAESLQTDIIAYLKKIEEKSDIVNQLTEVIARNLIAWDTSNDKQYGLLPEVYIKNKYWYEKLTGEEYKLYKAIKKYIG